MIVVMIRSKRVPPLTTLLQNCKVGIINIILNQCLLIYFFSTHQNRCNYKTALIRKEPVLIECGKPSLVSTIDFLYLPACLKESLNFYRFLPLILDSVL